MRTMYDSANPQSIPTNAEMVAGYINGLYKWKASDWQRFPNAQLVPVQVYIPGQPVQDDGLVLDIEANLVGSAIMHGIPQLFIQMRKAHGIRPCLYTSRSYYGALARLNLDCDYWIADYTGQPHLVPTTVATQYQQGKPGGYDLSLVSDNWQPKPVATLVLPPATGVGHDYTDANGYHFTYG